MPEILYKELSYQIIAALYDAFKTLGSSYKEKYCQKAVEQYLIKRSIPYSKELPVDLVVEGKFIGQHFLDFLIENKVVLEIK